MKTKLNAKSILITVGVILILLALLFPLFVDPALRGYFDFTLVVGKAYDVDSKTAADNVFSHLRMFVLSVGIALLCSAFRIKKLCRQKGVFPSLLSLSLFGGMGFGLFVCVLATKLSRSGWDTEGAKAAVVLGALCLICFCVSVYTYYKWLKPNFEQKEILRDTVFAVIYGSSFYYLSGIVYVFLCDVVRVHLW